MPLNNFNRLAAKPEHKEAVLKALADGEARSPQVITEASGLTLTQVKGAINELEREGKVVIQHNNTAPRSVVKLAGG
jgi:biotin operon repressor